MEQGTLCPVSFDVSAEAYDRFMGVWSRQLAPGLVELAGVTAGDRVLDVGCGPGALTAELVARLRPDAVAAVDPSEPFVDAARQRFPGVEVHRASAEDLPFPDGTFDAALAQLVVHFLTDSLAGVREMARVTRPGGVVAASVWDFEDGQGPLGPFWAVARDMDPGAAGEANRVGTGKGQLVELLRAAGLVDIEETALPVRRQLAGFDVWWEPFTQAVGPAGAYVAGLDPRRRAELRERCRAALPAGPFTLTARAWAARGVVRGRP